MTSIGSPVPLLLAKSKPYEIERSLRFNKSDSAYCSKTPSSAGNRKLLTISLWLKRSELTESEGIWISGTFTTGTACGGLYFDTNDQLLFYDRGNGHVSDRIEVHTKYKFRDTSAWYHIYAVMDKANAATKIYINGVEQTDLVANLQGDSSSDAYINNTNEHFLGRDSSGKYLHGYIAEMHFVDGTAVPVSSFGETNADTGQWVPKKFSGSYGTNGFYLNFSDNSNTTSGTLGKDSSGNSNDYTPNNFSVAAGIGNDSLTDTPNNNYPTFVTGTLDPNSEQGNGTGVLNGNLHQGLGDYIQRRSTIQFGPNGINSGKYYWEATLTSGDRATFCGITSNMDEGGGEVHSGADKSWVADENYKTYSATSSTTNTLTYASGVIYSFALDMDTSPPTLKAYRGNSLVYTDTSLPTDKNVTPFLFSTNSGSGVTFCNTDINFGQRPFTYTLPTGHTDCGTKNLPDPLIAKPNEYFNTVTYTGTGSDKVVTGVGFQPDLVWIKNRSHSGNWHDVYDSTRGVTKRIFPNEEDPEATMTEGLKAFSSDGFTVGNNSDVGASSNTYVGWNWKESATAGFDIVSYTGNAIAPGGGSQTISHSLGVKPEFYMVKALTAPYSGGGHWSTYHKDLSNPTDYFLRLNTNVSEITTSTSIWNQTAPTSSVFSVGYEYDSNHQGTNYIGYIFTSVPGYCAIGIYKGKGNVNGAFIYTGFRPAAVLVKSRGHNDSWQIWDDKRDTHNLMVHRLFPNEDADESDNTDTNASQLDFYSNGFKWKGTSDDTNGNNSYYVYIAWASTPFKYSNAR